MKYLSIAVFVLFALSGCKPNKEWQRKAIDSKENLLMQNAKAGKVDTTGVNELLKAYEKYSVDYPEDTMGANYLFRAADFYRYMRKPLKSIELYAKIYKNYSTFDKRPYALFLQGFIFENEVHEIDSARVKYQQFLTEYPNHPIAKDVKLTMDNLGKTPEEMMREFENKAHADSLAAAQQK